MTQQINRRTVTKGIAWSVPAVAIAGAAPAFADSGKEPTIAFVSACKLPGNSCGLPKDNKTYVFRFRITNHDPLKTVYFCDPVMTCVDGNCGGTWLPMPPGDGTACYKVDPGKTEIVNFRFENSTSSANLSFHAEISFTWGHTCPCSNDENNHPPITQNIYVPETKPQNCPCGAYGDDRMAKGMVEERPQEESPADEAMSEQPVEEEAPLAEAADADDALEEETVVEEAPAGEEEAPAGETEEVTAEG